MRVRPWSGGPVTAHLRASASIEFPRPPDERLGFLLEAVRQAVAPVVSARLVLNRDDYLVQAFELAALQRHLHIGRVPGRTAFPARDVELRGHLVMPPTAFDGG